MTDPMQLLRQVRQALQVGDYDTAISALTEAAQRTDAAHNDGMTARHLGNLALIYYRNQQPERALSCFGDALRYARLDGDPLTESGLLGNIGNILRELRRFDDALPYLQEALRIAQSVGDVRGEGIWLSNLGLVYDDLGQVEAAITHHQQAVMIAETLQDLRGLATRLANLGHSLVEWGDAASAMAQFERASDYYEQLAQPQAAYELREYIQRLQHPPR